MANGADDSPAGLGGSPPSAAAGPTPGSIPGRPAPGAPGTTGISPAMANTGNQGAEMEARVAVNFLANRLTEMAGKLGLSSELGKAMHKAAGILAKAVPPGSIPPGAEVAQMQRIMQSGRQNAANVAAMRQSGAGAAPGGAPPSARPPVMPQAPGAMAA